MTTDERIARMARVDLEVVDRWARGHWVQPGPRALIERAAADLARQRHDWARNASTFGTDEGDTLDGVDLTAITMMTGATRDAVVRVLSEGPREGRHDRAIWLAIEERRTGRRPKI